MIDSSATNPTSQRRVPLYPNSTRIPRAHLQQLSETSTLSNSTSTHNVRNSRPGSQQDRLGRERDSRQGRRGRLLQIDGRTPEGRKKRSGALRSSPLCPSPNPTTAGGKVLADHDVSGEQILLAIMSGAFTMAGWHFGIISPPPPPSRDVGPC